MLARLTWRVSLCQSPVLGRAVRLPDDRAPRADRLPRRRLLLLVLPRRAHRQLHRRTRRGRRHALPLPTLRLPGRWLTPSTADRGNRYAASSSSATGTNARSNGQAAPAVLPRLTTSSPSPMVARGGIAPTCEQRAPIATSAGPKATATWADTPSPHHDAGDSAPRPSAAGQRSAEVGRGHSVTTHCDHTTPCG